MTVKDELKMTPDEWTEMVEWVATRPESVKELMLRFPPASIIEAPGHCIPSVFVGSRGRIVGYTEDGCLIVQDEWPLNFGMRGHVKADDAKLVETAKLTIEGMREVMTEARGRMV